MGLLRDGDLFYLLIAGEQFARVIGLLGEIAAIGFDHRLSFDLSIIHSSSVARTSEIKKFEFIYVIRR